MMEDLEQLSEEIKLKEEELKALRKEYQEKRMSGLRSAL